MEKILSLIELSIDDIIILKYNKIIINFVISEYEYEILSEDGFEIEISQIPFGYDNGTFNLKTGIILNRIEYTY